MYFLQYSRDKEDENGQAFLGINMSPLLISPPAASGQLRGETNFIFVSKELVELQPNSQTALTKV
jgi:hypothetical protein